MDIIFYFAALLTVTFAIVTSSLAQMHMFQLNSYSAVKHVRWMSKNYGMIFTHVISLLFAADALFPVSEKWQIFVYSLFAVLLAVFGFVSIPKKKAKKPLVFTTRVIRMFVTETVLVALVGVGSYFVYKATEVRFAIALMFLAYALVPFLIIVSNFINAPIEAGVRQHYINDAKKILKSCPDLKIIGITGSYGKTSMKFFLTTLLKGKYDVLMTPESYNTPMGVVKTIRSSLKGYHEIFVCEMGAKKVKEIDELCRIAGPQHGIVTSIGPQHLETFKSVENVIKTKFELADYVIKDGGNCFVNIDNEYIKNNLPKEAVTYGTCDEADYKAEVISVSKAGTAFSVRFPDGEIVELQSILIGAHNVVNLCGAVAMAHFMGVSPSEIKAQMPKITAVPHRLQLLEKGPYTIIDDAFNSNPAGSAAALDTLALFEDFKILVTPGMVELGAKEEECNREFGRHAAKVCDYVVLVGKKQTEPICNGLKDEGYPDEKIYVADSFNEGIQAAYNVTADRRKIILLENDLPDNY
jgi:UDP-N-acetylmuramoyl-tripeptide--D-alanyl-D-alanine ligase